MNRTAVTITMTIFLAACSQSLVALPVSLPSPVASPTAAPTLEMPTVIAIPLSMPTVAATPLSCDPAKSVLKIMPLGDSITYGEGIPSYGGYRNLLSALLESDGIKFDFVGSQKSGEESLLDPDNEGHPGWRISNLREAIATEGWLETYQPDIILLHIGSNDLRYGNQVYAAENLSLLLDDILARLPETHIIVATIIRTRWGSDLKHLYYNGKVREIVASKGPQVSLVDMQDVPSKGDFTTLYHPSPKGYDKMAHAWESAILALGLDKGCFTSK
jgi:lysophospholipase L1-like esterase